MTVKAILSSKRGDVITIEPTATLEAAIKVLTDNRIGALVVAGPDKRVAGIISERDIVNALGGRGSSVLSEPVGQVMTRKVVTCGEADTVVSIMGRMTDGKFRHVPVVDRGRLIGIVSIGDVVKHRLEEMERETGALREYILTA
jgi:CBS domain-containing protein